MLSVQFQPGQLKLRKINTINFNIESLHNKQQNCCELVRWWCPQPVSVQWSLALTLWSRYEIMLNGHRAGFCHKHIATLHLRELHGSGVKSQWDVFATSLPATVSGRQIMTLASVFEHRDGRSTMIVGKDGRHRAVTRARQPSITYVAAERRTWRSGIVVVVDDYAVVGSMRRTWC